MKQNYKDFLDKETIPGGLPVSYPIPQVNDMLFYIQRNQNTNTVVYQINYGPDKLINLNQPMTVYWIKYTQHGKIENLNFIQNKLAYGYEHDVISGDLIQFTFVSHPKTFYIVFDEKTGRHVVKTTFGKEMANLSNIYVYAEEYGAFPVVKFVDVYGLSQKGEIISERLEFL